MAEKEEKKKRNRPCKVKEKEQSLKLTYTDEDRIKVVRLLIDNGMNYVLTHRQTGINSATIKQWYYRYKKDIEDSSTATMIAEKVEIDFARAKLELLQNNFSKLNTLADAAIMRAIALCQVETDLNKLNGTLKIIFDLICKFNESSQEQQQTSGATINIIQESIVQLNQLKQDQINKIKENAKDVKEIKPL